MTKIIKLIKSPIFAIVINILSLLSTILCLIFVSVEYAGILFLVSAILFIIFLIVSIYFKNWKYVLINFLIMGFSLFAISKYLDIATLSMYEGNHNELKNGDIIFQTSKSLQSEAIQIVTKSKYSHMGIIYLMKNEYFVYEASGTVRLTPLEDWINKGIDRKYVVKRIKNSDNILTKDVLNKMKSVGEKYKGKGYDKFFEWSDNKLYCSELVWKIYKQSTNLELGSLEKLSDFDLTNKEVQNLLNNRYHGKIPYNELVISPAKMYNSDRLETVEEN